MRVSVRQSRTIDHLSADVRLKPQEVGWYTCEAERCYFALKVVIFHC